MKRDVLLNIPTELACHIVGVWLDLRIIASLDIAYCNITGRQKLHALFQSPSCVLEGEIPFERVHPFMKWVLHRSLRIKRMSLGSHVSLLDLKSYFKRFGSSIQRIRRGGCKNEDDNADVANLIAKYAPNITHLFFDGCTIDESVFEILKNCTSLRDVRLIGCICKRRRTYDKISAPTPCSLNIPYIDYSWTIGECGTPLLYLLTFIQPLCMLRLKTSCFQQIETVKTFSNLKILDLTDQIRLKDAQFVEIIAACPKIVHVNVTECVELTDISGLAIARGLVGLRCLAASGTEFTNETLYELAELRADTLEALCTKSWDKLNGHGYTQVLLRCPWLHTIQLDMLEFTRDDGYNIDPTCMVRISTLLLFCNEYTRQEYVYPALFSCRQLQVLRLVYPASLKIEFSCVFHFMPEFNTLWCNIYSGTQSQYDKAQINLIRMKRPSLRYILGGDPFHVNIMVL